MAGATGVGKSTIFAEMMKCCLMRGKKATYCLK
ncbi:hypothetical protein PSJ59_24325 [Escherichia coli]|nr:hypothetical protein [Escherichia coli]